MSNQCVHCGKIIEDASQELLSGCSSCGSRFFFFIKKENLEKLKESPIELSVVERKKVEEDVREMIGATDPQIPIVLDLESVRVVGPGKFVIDVVNLFRKDRPLIYKLEEGKYIIDLASTLQKYNTEKSFLSLKKKAKKVKKENIADVSEEDKKKIIEMVKEGEN